MGKWCRGLGEALARAHGAGSGGGGRDGARLMWRGDKTPLVAGSERGRLPARRGPQNSCCFWLCLWWGVRTWFAGEVPENCPMADAWEHGPPQNALPKIPSPKCSPQNAIIPSQNNPTEADLQLPTHLTLSCLQKCYQGEEGEENALFSWKLP